MTGIGMALKALGVKVEDEHLRAVEALIPQIPGKVSEAWNVLNNVIRAGDERLSEIEHQIRSFREEIEGLTRIIKELQSATNGTTNTGTGTDTRSSGKPAKPNGRGN